MTFAEFKMHLQKLTNQFGAHVYSEDRVRLIFREVSFLPVSSWEKIVDKFLAESRIAPLLPEIREAIAIQREKLYAEEKARHQKDAEEFFASSLSNDEKSYLSETIKARMFNQVDDARWEKFLSDLNRATN